MKKLLSLTLSIVLLICSVSISFTAFAATVSDAAEHFENTNNWHLGKISSNTVDLTSDIKNNGLAWAYVTTVSENVYSSDSTSSVSVACNYHSAWLDLPDLEANTNYTLTFNYSAPNSETINYAFSSIGIYSPTVGGTTADVKVSGGDFYASDGYFVRKSFVSPTSYTSADGTAANAVQTSETTYVADSSATWHEMTLSFNSGELNDFIMIIKFDSVTPVCMDNFVLEYEEYFETESNWRVDAYTSDPASATIGYKDAFANAKVTRSDAFAEDGRDTVMKVFTPSQFTSIILPDIEANTNYTLSFSYYGDMLYNGYIFERMGIYAPDVEGANFGYKNKGFILELGATNGYTTTDFETYVDISQNTTVSSANEWYDVRLTFNSGELGRIAFVFVSKVDSGYAYIDDMTLVPDEKTTHFENPDNWHLGRKSSNAVDLTSDIKDSGLSWAKVASDRTNVYSDNSTSSVSVACNYNSAWLDLPDLEANTNYTLTFNYSAPNSDTINYAFTSVGIYSPTIGGTTADVKISGGDFYASDGYFVRKSSFEPTCYTSADGTAANAVQTSETTYVADSSATWHEMTLSFNSGKLNDFVMILTFDSVTPVCMDNFVLEYEEYFETESNWRVDAYTSDPASATIGYKDAFANAKVTRSDAFAEDGRDTVMKVFTPSQFTSIILPELDANYDYTLTFEYYGEAITAGCVFSRMGIYAPDVDGANFKYQNKGFILDILSSGGYTTTDFESYEGTSQNTAQTVAEAWHTISLSFNSGDLGRLALVFVSAIDTDHNAYVDNFTLTKGAFSIQSAAKDVIGFKGNSIRQKSDTLAQGLRFKFFMDNDYESLYSAEGYTVAETGVIALPELFLGENELLLGETYYYNETAHQPSSGLVTEDNLQYDEDDSENVYFTAALINIGQKSTGAIDYSDYSKALVVRAYTIYEDENGSRTTVYSKQQAATVFDVVYAILSDPQSDTDKDAAESAIANCTEEYENWVTENHPAS